MPKLCTTETEYLSTFLTHASLSFALALGPLDLRLAVWSWTPLFVLVLGDVLDFVKIHVLLHDGSRTQLLDVLQLELRHALDSTRTRNLLNDTLV